MKALDDLQLGLYRGEEDEGDDDNNPGGPNNNP